jgi:putative two-component system response regulator
MNSTAEATSSALGEPPLAGSYPGGQTHQDARQSGTRRRILVVDDEPSNLNLMRQILKDGYDLAFAKSGVDALHSLRMKPADLILLDVMMPGMDGYEVCATLKADPRTRGIPIIFCTALGDSLDEVKGFELGAVDYITKPVRPVVVKARVGTHLALYDQSRAFEAQIRITSKDLIDSRLQALQMLGRAAEYKDNETGLHVVRMSNYAELLAKADGWPEEECELIKHAAPMHDIGKIGIADQILMKPGPLTAAEFAEIKRHPEIGSRIIGELGQNSRLFALASSIALTHHEKWDGTGYPNGLRGEDIPLHGRIVALADVFDALTSRRPYKQPWPLDKTIEFLQAQASRHFDPRLVDLFVSRLSEVTPIMARWGEHGEVEKPALPETTDGVSVPCNRESAG